MDTIAQGNTQTYIMDDGNSLDVLTKGVASYSFIPFGVAANETTGQVLSTQGVTKLGPFWVQTTVKITATNGACRVAAMIEKADCLPQCDDIVRAVIDPLTGGITKIWTGTQAAYDALTPADDTLYIIVEA